MGKRQGKELTQERIMLLDCEMSRSERKVEEDDDDDCVRNLSLIHI